ncbi:hypothetical protein VIGAN_05225600, partial [Vigna angularis var. angularis]
SISRSFAALRERFSRLHYRPSVVHSLPCESVSLVSIIEGSRCLSIIEGSCCLSIISLNHSSSSKHSPLPLSLSPTSFTLNC